MICRVCGINLCALRQRKDIRKLVIGENLKLIAMGVAGGLVCAFALTRLLQRLLYGVSVTDPLTFGGITLVLLMVSLLACWIPAQRATQVDPLIALRSE